MNTKYTLRFTPLGWLLSRGRKAVRIRFDDRAILHDHDKPWLLESVRGMPAWRSRHKDITDAMEEVPRVLRPERRRSRQ